MKFRVTIPTSTHEHNKVLDAQILRKEQPDEITREASWYRRLWEATAYTTLKRWRQ
jgi:hypothetical protein